MKLGTLFSFIGATVGGAIGWWVGSQVGFWTAWVVSGVATGIGMWYGRKKALDYM